MMFFYIFYFPKCWCPTKRLRFLETSQKTRISYSASTPMHPHCLIMLPQPAWINMDIIIWSESHNNWYLNEREYGLEVHCDTCTRELRLELQHKNLMGMYSHRNHQLHLPVWATPKPNIFSKNSICVQQLTPNERCTPSINEHLSEVEHEHKLGFENVKSLSWSL